MSENNPKNDMMEMLDIELPPEANLQLADNRLVTYYKNYQNRAIWLDKEISDDLWEETRLILQWNREDKEANIPVEKRKPIKIYIHSFGGDMDACFGLIDVMNKSKTPVMTINMNSCLSAGGIILINGHKGLRYCMPMSVALIHQGQGGAGGSFEAVVAQTENYKKLIGMMKDNILSHTNITKQLLTKNSKKEWYIYADQQVELGLVDHIIENIDDIL